MWTFVFLPVGRLDKTVPEGLPPSAPAAIRGYPHGLLSPENSLLVHAVPHSIQHVPFLAAYRKAHSDGL